MKRIVDLVFVVVAICILIIPMIIIAVVVKASSKGTVLYFSERVGKSNKLFSMPKFRTMEMCAPTVATHILENPSIYVTPIGQMLRRTSLDELPQLWSILIGDMSLVGPRPALYNQKDLICKRTEKGIHELMPGLTGWAQINGRDEHSIDEKVRFDEDYLHSRSILLDLQILLQTFKSVSKRSGVSH